MREVATRRCSREIRDAVVARAIQLGPRQVWIADIFCLPEYRSQAVSRHLILFADRELASEGYTDALAAVDADNAPSLRTSFRSGSEATRHVSYLRLFGYERLSIRTQLPSPLRARLEPRQ